MKLLLYYIHSFDKFNGAIKSAALKENKVAPEKKPSTIKLIRFFHDFL